MDKAFKILVIEDNPADADLLKEYLNEITEFNARMTWVPTLKEGQSFLQTDSFNAILVDLSLPDSHGLETVKSVVDHSHASTVIVLTSLDDKDNAIDAIESGAQDYLVKSSLDAEALSRVIRYAVQRNKSQLKIREAYEQLYQSQKMESIGRLAAGMAHDFNNQLSAINFLCSLAQGHLSAEHEANKYLEQILAVSEISSELIKRLLTFSAKLPVNLKVVDLNQILSNSHKLLSKLLDSDFELIVKGCPGAMIRVDPVLIEHVLMNLVINARDAMPEGGKITFESSIAVKKKGPQEIKQVILKVSDTGVGIQAENLSKIFEPFYTTKASGKGTGLGLAMVYGTIEACCGTLSVDSTVGVGTTFTITFPHAEVTPVSEAENNEIKKGNLQNQNNKSVTNATILLVEDDHILRKAFEEVLKRNGYKVLPAQDGVAALEIVLNHEEKIDLVLTDLSMPNMGGIKLSENLMLRNPSAKIILMSGYTEKLSDITAGTIQCAGFISKPTTTKILLERVKDILSC